MVIPVSGSGKFYAALCIGGCLQGDLQSAVVWPYILVAEVERTASEPWLLIRQHALCLQTGHSSQDIPGSPRPFPAASKDRSQVGSSCPKER